MKFKGIKKSERTFETPCTTRFIVAASGIITKTPEKHNKEAKDWSKKTEKLSKTEFMLQKPVCIV